MRTTICSLVLLVGGLLTLHADDAAAIRSINPAVLSGDEAKDLPKTLSNDYRRRIQEANLRESQAWKGVATREQWEKFRDDRIEALRRANGELPAAPQKLNLRVTGTISGPDYRIEKLIYETRPGFWASAQLYLPATPPAKMPGLMVIHAHHTPATHSELQDLGIGWARVGCAVIVPELIGHGERRQHEFRTETDYPKPFRPSRQDYYFRYNSGAQLHLVGDSLMGWFAWDLSRGIDVLLNHAKADPDRIIVFGAVAGGGDPAGVLSAVDRRVSGVVPYNFGGGQPDYTTPEDTDRTFYWFGHGSWESTRALAFGARDGFAHWVIVGAAAPKPLILAHEFAWDAAKDPAWPRLQKVYGFYNSQDKLGFSVGKGSVKGKGGPDNTHCTHIGDFHRQKLDPYLEKWFGIPAPKKPEMRHTSDELACWTDALKAELKPRTLHDAAGEVFDARASAALKQNRSADDVRKAWAKQLGNVLAADSLAVVQPPEETPAVSVYRFTMETDPGVKVPCVLLQPKTSARERRPVVVMVSHAGKAAFLKERAAEIDAILKSGTAVCLVDVRGTGETRPSDTSRGRNSTLTSISESEWLLGQTLLGSQLRDLRTVLRYLGGRKDVDGTRIAVWGDSFASPSAADFRAAVPLDADLPGHAEPTGALLAMFAALYEPEIVKAVYARGGLLNYRSVLGGPYLYVPHEAMVPGAANAGDLAALATAISRPIRLEEMVDALNRRVSDNAVSQAYPTAKKSDDPPVKWVTAALAR